MSQLVLSLIGRNIPQNHIDHQADRRKRHYNPANNHSLLRFEPGRPLLAGEGQPHISVQQFDFRQFGDEYIQNIRGIRKRDFFAFHETPHVSLD